MNTNNAPESADETKEEIEEEEIGETRHDEEISAKGIVRSLFMANEPEQRKEVDESENQSNSKAKD